MSTSVLSVHSLSKRYGSLQALDNVSFEVPRGTIFGLLGPNGSGKTTLLGISLRILQATAGNCSWADDIRPAALLETPNFYPYLSGRANLEITCQLRGGGQGEIGRVLERVGLAAQPKLPFSSYSLGMKQRLAIGATLLNDSSVLVLDEPTNGLDPQGIADVRKLIREVAAEGRTVLLASHLLDEVEKVCTDVAILKKGRLLSSGPMADVLRDEDTLELAAADLDKLAQVIRSHPLAPRVSASANGVTARFDAGQVDTADVNRFCMEQGVALSLLHLRKKTLETRFLELTDDRAVPA